MMKRTLGIGFLLLLLLMVGGWWHHATYHDQYVTVGETPNLLTLLNLHGEPAKYLRIYGHNYDNVRGLPPCYLQIPELDAILFVTRKYHQDSIFHIINLGTKRETKIDGPYADFGGHIGSGRKNGEPYTDFVERADSNTVVLATAFSDAKKRYYLNLPKNKLEKIVYDELDVTGQIKKTSVYMNGELVQSK